uniref:Uncharacterized protein n=1 Tax=Plectus sambesii TaxID=2011161 RepID=A0A914WAG8_9BILA
MAGFDDPGLFYHDRFFANDDNMPDDGREMIAEYRDTLSQFKRFIREFNVGGFGMIYRTRRMIEFAFVA